MNLEIAVNVQIKQPFEVIKLIHGNGEIKPLCLLNSRKMNRMQAQKRSVLVDLTKALSLLKRGHGKIVNAVFVHFICHFHTVAVTVTLENGNKIFVVAVFLCYRTGICTNFVKVNFNI